AIGLRAVALHGSYWIRKQRPDRQWRDERRGAAGTAVTLHVTFSKSMTAGQDYKGELQLGPPAVPTLLTVPIVVHRR
ncbi:MAG TPA: hypothetical protein VGA45_00660, partial [Actinomycetota bacterium]